MLAVLAGQLRAQGDVGALLLVVNGLAQIMQQAGALGNLHIGAHFGGHEAGQVAYLDGVLEHVLPIAGAVFHAAQQAHDFGVQAMLAGLKDGLLAGFLDGLFHVALGLLHHLLNAGGVDAAVLQQLFNGQAGGLAADGVKGRYDDGLGGVVDDEVNAGGCLQRADVAALTADNAALHVVVGQADDRHGALGHMVAGTALDGGGDDVAGLFVALLAGLELDVAHKGGGVMVGFLLHTADDDLGGLVGGDARDAL